MTDKQVCEITAASYPQIKWEGPQIERQKRKFIDRPGKPATRFALLTEVAKGHRGKLEAKGSPSEYRVKGLAQFLGPKALAALELQRAASLAG